jgi:hypothetical protein
MRFGRYELLSRLGAGGMGEVWRARDHDLHRDVAVKFLPDRFAADPVRLGRFAQEAKAASKLNHPNIVTIHEIGETSGLPYIVMELVDGQTLRDLLLAQEGRPVPTRRLLEIGAQAADGLAKAHAEGIVHRDLKPENVMLTADGFVKILDFGLAKLRADVAPGSGRGAGGAELWFDSGQPTWPESVSPHTAVGAVVGTAGYMSPEQARGQAVDFRSDQFALGAILYELATGRQAFRRETPAQTIAAIIEDPPEPIATLNQQLPAPLRWVIERCLAKEPAERYASTLDLARELRGLRERLAEFGGSGSLPGRGRWPASRRRRITVLVLSLAAAGTLSWQAGSQPGRGGDAELAVAVGVGAGDRRAGSAVHPGVEAHRRSPIQGTGPEPRRQGSGGRPGQPADRAPRSARALPVVAVGRAVRRGSPVGRDDGWAGQPGAGSDARDHRKRPAAGGQAGPDRDARGR